VLIEAPATCLILARLQTTNITLLTQIYAACLRVTTDCGGKNPSRYIIYAFDTVYAVRF